jgi:hypothetical protein
MRNAQCPVCYTPLEVRAVTPCFYCGAWPEQVALFKPTDEFREWRLPSGQRIVLCRPCELEEFLVPGGWGYRLNLGTRWPLNALEYVRQVQDPQLGQDKFCPTCNMRLAFLAITSQLVSSAS